MKMILYPPDNPRSDMPLRSLIQSGRKENILLDTNNSLMTP